MKKENGGQWPVGDEGRAAGGYICFRVRAARKGQTGEEEEIIH